MPFDQLDRNFARSHSGNKPPFGDISLLSGAMALAIVLDSRSHYACTQRKGISFRHKNNGGNGQQRIVEARPKSMRQTCVHVDGTRGVQCI